MLKLISRPPIPLITVIVAACLAAHGVACSGVHYQDTPCSRHRSVYLLLATRATACSLDFCPNNWKSPPSPSPPPVIIHHSITNAAAAAVLCFSATKLDRITRRITQWTIVAYTAWLTVQRRFISGVLTYCCLHIIPHRRSPPQSLQLAADVVDQRPLRSIDAGCGCIALSAVLSAMLCSRNALLPDIRHAVTRFLLAKA